jgi:hypothetical protein
MGRLLEGECNMCTKGKLMKVHDAFTQIKNLCNALKMYPEMSFKYTQVKSWEGPFKDWFREEVPGKGISKKSGVYIFSDNESNILYIGKAASGNLGAEIYGKFGAATTVDKKNGPYFGNSSMAKWAPDKCADYFLKGDVFISAVSVAPKEFSSLVEVYLHIWCAINGGLPPLNKQIG